MCRFALRTVIFIFMSIFLEIGGKAMNNVKKIMSSLLVAVIILTAAPLSGFMGLKLNFDWFDFSTKSSAEVKELAPTGQCGENVYWTFDKDTGLLTISGSGSMYNYMYNFNNYSCSSPFSLTSIIRIVIIEDGVTRIGDWTFLGCIGLTNITIPDSVTSLGLSPFGSCIGIRELKMPCSLKFDEYSSLTCTDIEKITLTKGTGKMNDFNTNPKLNSNYYAYTPWYISKDNMKEIILEDGITSIGNYAFYNCTGLTSVTIPDSVTNIGSSAFSGCSGLTSITIPDSVTSIGSAAFFDCIGLTNITIPDGIANVSSSVFSGCTGLKELTMPCSVGIYWDSFLNCSNIEKVTLTKGTGKMNDYSNSNFNSNYYAYTPWYISKDNMKEIILEDGITSIDNCAFYNCSGLTSVTIPNGVTSIGESAFSGCTGLASITIPESITSIGSYAFSGCTGLKELSMSCSVEISWNSFSECSNIEKITLTKGTGEMNDDSDFNYVSTPWYISKDSIKEIILEDGITSIGNYAFKDCTGLTSITIPGSVTSIGSSAFSGCTGLMSITIPDGITSISDSTFYGCSGLTNITLPDSITSIGSSAFSGCTGLTNVKIPNSVTSIGSSAFSGCSRLTNVKIPNSVTSISSSAFSGCSGLTSVTLPNSITSIGNSAFLGCTGLTGITIPDSVTRIGSSAFQGCTGLTSITIPDSVTSISSRAFYDCKTIYYNAKNAITDSSAFYSAEKIIVGDTVQTIPNDFARDCDNIKSITIASSVVKIGNDAFNHCDNLESVTFMGDNRIEMGSNIFEYCNKLKIHCKDNSFIAAYAEMNNLTYSIIDYDGNPEYDIKNGMILSYIGNDKKLFVSSGTKIGFGAFENNPVVTDVELSSIVTKIYNKAFANCTNLSKIIIPQSVASIGDNAFEGCDKLTIWCYAGSYAEAYAINHDIPVKYINLQLNENTIKLNTNESVNLCASFNTELSDEIELIWTSDNPSVVTVTSDGRITAVGKGKATITATSSTGLYATCVVNVDTVEQEKPRVNSVKIDDISLNYKKSTTLKPTIKADEGAKYKVEYSTSNAKVATVDKNGKVYAAKKGSATITCTVTDSNGNTVTDTCKVTVKYSFGQWLIKILLFGWIWY